MRSRLLTTFAAAALAAATTPLTLKAQISVTPDTAAQVREAGDSLQVVYWAIYLTPRSQQVMVHNRTDMPLVIRSYTVTDCVGILLRQCQQHTVQVSLLPHHTRALTRIQTRQDIRGGFGYRILLTVAPPAAPAQNSSSLRS